MRKILTCAAMSVFLFSGCSFHPYGAINVNGDIITKSEIEQIVDNSLDNSFLKNFGGSKNFIKTDESPLYVAIKKKAIDELIEKTLLEAEIKKRGIKATDEDIKEETKAIIDKLGSKEELDKLLKSRNVSAADFKKDLVSQIKTKKLVKSIKNIEISDADAKEFYKNNKDRFKTEDQVRASHILLSVDTLQIIRDLKAKNKDITPEELNKKVEAIDAEKKAKAEAILKEVKANPESFAAVARRESDDKMSGERGGELGFFAKGKMVPEFSKVAFAMKPNTISDIVKTNYGYHIIKVTDRVEAGITPFEKIKDEIKFYLEVQEQYKVIKNLTEGLKKTSKIEYYSDSYNPDKITEKVNKAISEQQKQGEKTSDTQKD